MKISYCQEQFPLGTGGSINQALDLIEEDTFIAMNGDDWLDIKFSNFINFYKKNNYKGIIATKLMQDASRYGIVHVDNNTITSFEEKQPNSSGLISTGVYILSKELFYYAPLRSTYSIEKDCFPVWIKRGLGAYTTTAKFIDIGTPESYKEAQTYIR